MGLSHCQVLHIEQAPLNPAAAMAFVADPSFGGMAQFVGSVRNHHQGRAVLGISYDLFDALALKVFEDICEKVHQEFGPQLRLYVAHAKGRLQVGDLAVVVAAGSPRRDAAFRACRAVIEAVKHQAPVWKQEHYVDGDSQWTDGTSLRDSTR